MLKDFEGPPQMVTSRNANFFKSKSSGPTKSRTSKSSSHEAGDSAHFSLDLNDEAGASDDVEVHEIRPMGRDTAKKKHQLQLLIRKDQPQLLLTLLIMTCCSINGQMPRAH